MQRVNEQIEQSRLLVGKVLGTLTQEQEQRLQEWEKDDANKEIEKSILNANSFENWNQRMDRLNTSDEWDHFVDFMKNEKIKRKVVRMRIFKGVASIAAAVLVIGFGFYYKYQETESGQGFQAVSEVNIAPGSSYAKLILGDGKEVDLRTSKENIIAQGNVTIANAKGVLQYNNGNEQKKIAPVVNTLVIPRGGEYQLVLPDGTKVWLNSETQLSYSVPFSDKERRVQLKGEAYFEVAHDKTKPFVVETDKQDVQVLGTHFNVSAYANDLNVVTTLVEGKVKVEHRVDNQDKEAYFLFPDDQLVFNKKTQNAQKRKVDTYSYTAWKDGRFVFDKESLESFFEKLSRWYNVDVVVVDESIKKINFTGDLPRNKNMTEILSIMEEEMSVHVKVKDNKVIYVTK